MTNYTIMLWSLVIILAQCSQHAHALPVKTTDAQFSDAMMDTDETAIDRLFETTANAELEHSINARQDVTIVAATDEQQRVVDEDDMLANVYVDGDNAQRSREQHGLFSFGLGSRWSAPMEQTDLPLVAEDTDPVVRDNQIVTEASAVAAAAAVMADAVDAFGQAIVSAETTALDHIASIVGDTDVLKELRVDIPKEDYVPLDVPVNHSNEMRTDGGDNEGTGNSVAYVTHQMIDASMQYDMEHSNVKTRCVRQLIDLANDELEPRDRHYYTPELRQFFRTNNFTYRLLHRLPEDRRRSQQDIHDDVFVKNLEAYLILFTGRRYTSHSELSSVLHNFLVRKRFMDNRRAWLIPTVEEYMADVSYFGMGNSTARLPEYMLTGNQTADQHRIDRLTFNRRWGAELTRRVDAFNAQQAQQDAAKEQRRQAALERQRAGEAERHRKEADLSVITIEREMVNSGDMVETINAELGPNKVVVLERDMNGNHVVEDRIAIMELPSESKRLVTVNPTTTTEAAFVELTTPHWHDDFEVDELVPWYVMTDSERKDTEFAAYLHALIAVNEVGPLKPFYFIETRTVRAANASGVAADAVVGGNVTIAENDHGKLVRTTDGIVLEVKEQRFGAQKTTEDVDETITDNITAIPDENGPIVTRSELLHAELLLPPVAERTPSSDSAAVANEAHVSDGNKLEASEQVYAIITDDLRLQPADGTLIAPQTARNDLPAIYNTYEEGSGDDSSDSFVAANAAVRSDVKVAVAMSDERNAEDVHVGTDPQDAMHSFGDAAAESASIRQARSRSSVAVAALADARTNRPVLLLTELALLALSIALTVGVWQVYRRVQDVAHV